MFNWFTVIIILCINQVTIIINFSYNFSPIHSLNFNTFRIAILMFITVVKLFDNFESMNWLVTYRLYLV